jgi:hypothetical protein
MTKLIEVPWNFFPPVDSELIKADVEARKRREAESLATTLEEECSQLRGDAAETLREKGSLTRDRFVLHGLTQFRATPYIYRLDKEGKPTETGIRLREELTEDGLITTDYVLEITRSSKKPPVALFKISRTGPTTGGDGKNVNLGGLTDIRNHLSFIREHVPPSH